MAQFVVKQPDGKFALFSEVVDNFIKANCNADQMIAYLRSRGMDKANAEVKVGAGINDRCLFTKKCMESNWRWNYATGVIKDIHGQECLDEMLADMGVKL